ncbi:hypothetical protein [Clostridium tertium]
MEYCFEDIVTISVISDPVNRINNKPALEEFMRKISLGQGTYIKILELTFEAQPIFKTIIYEGKIYRVKIDGLNTSSPYVKKIVGNRLIEREDSYRVLYDLYYDNSFIENIFWYRKV